QVKAMRVVLADSAGGAEVPEVIVLTKANRADPGTVAALRTRYPGAVAVSARTGAGVEEPRGRIGELRTRPTARLEVVLPYACGPVVSRAHATGEVLAEEHAAAGTQLTALVDESLAADLAAAQPA